MAKRDFYAVLEVGRDAGAEDIKKAFRKLAIKHHPDKNPGNKKAEELFKEASEAYETLGDPKKREIYDQYGESGFANTGGGGFGAGGFGQSADRAQDIFGDLFGDIFGAGHGRSQGRSRARQRGADLRYSLTVTLEEAAVGCEKLISFMRIRDGQEDAAKLSVKVPSGVKNGQRLKLTREGDGSPNGGISGDLYVIIQLQDHALFRREEEDLVLDLPLSYTDAILGTSVEVPTLTNKVSLKIPPGTHTGQVFRMKGKGFPKMGQFSSGDMLVRVLVDTPEKIDSQQKSLLEELSRLQSDTPLVKSYKEKLQTVLKNRP